MTKSEMMEIIQNAIKHWLKPGDSGVLALHIGKEKTKLILNGLMAFLCLTATKYLH